MDNRVNAHDVATAYGLLWLFQGNSDLDPNAKLAFSARHHLRDLLTQDELRQGIVRAKEIAAAKGVVTEPWM